MDMMKVERYNKVIEGSNIYENINGKIHYMDSYKVDIVNKNNYSIDYLTATIFNYSPKWVDLLVHIRNFIVKPFGIKTEAVLEKQTLNKSIRYNRGDKVDAFPVIERSDSEIIMGEDDKHLYFRISVFIQNKPNSNNQTVYLTTIVTYHNILGKAYFTLIKLFHMIIARGCLLNLVKQIRYSDD